MSDHDMSQAACIARATRTAEHYATMKRVNLLTDIVTDLKRTCAINRDSIDLLKRMIDLQTEEIKCLKSLTLKQT